MLHPLKPAYWTQKAAAKQRGIGWELTFNEWLSIWRTSGHLHERGCKRGQYVMARFFDRGAYAVGNVRIVPAEVNVTLGNGPLSDEHKRTISAALRGRPSPLRGRTLSPETKLKMSLAKRGSNNPMFGRQRAGLL